MQRHEAVRCAEETRNSSEWLEHGGSHETPPRASEAMPNTWGLDPKSTDWTAFRGFCAENSQTQLDIL